MQLEEINSTLDKTLIKQHKTLLLVCSVYIVLNHLTVGVEFSANHAFVLFIQENSFPLIDLFFQIVTDCGLGFFVFFPFLLVVIDTEILRSLRYVAWVTIGIGIQTILKEYYGYPRPWWVYSDIIAKACNTDMGRPSGHSFTSMTSGILLYYLYLAKETKQEDEFLLDNKNSQPPSHNKLYITILSTLISIIGFSRIYLAAHSFDQVLLGFSYAIVYTAIILAFVEPRLLEKLTSIKTGEDVLSVKDTLMYAGMWIALFFSPYFIYLVQINLANIDESWIQAINQVCGPRDLNNILFAGTLYHSKWINIGLAIVLMLQLVVAYYVEEEDEFDADIIRDKKRLALGVAGCAVCMLIAIPISALGSVFWRFTLLGIVSALLGFCVVICHHPNQYYLAVPGKPWKEKNYCEQSPQFSRSPHIRELAVIHPAI